MSSVSRGLASSLSKMKVKTTIFFATSQQQRDEKINDYLDVVSLQQVDFRARDDAKIGGKWAGVDWTYEVEMG